MKYIIGSLLSAGMLLAASLPASADSVVQITADVAGLTPVDGTSLSGTGTFWILQAGANGQLNTLPLPFLSPDYLSLPIYQVTNNIYLVDNSGDQGATTSAIPPFAFSVPLPPATI